jgi:hypothetical protein
MCPYFKNKKLGFLTKVKEFKRSFKLKYNIIKYVFLREEMGRLKIRFATALIATLGFAILGIFAITAATAPLSLPTGLSPVAGGIADQRPYFGRFKTAPDDSEGDFLLATCGCGDWRVLLSTADGKQWEFPVRFYSVGDYQPTGDVTVFGQTDTEALLGTVHQDAGLADGLSIRNAIVRKFSAKRSETHTNDASSCVKCHVGDNPIRPQSPDHPSRCTGGVTTGCFTVDPPNCLSCHTVVIKN